MVAKMKTIITFKIEYDLYSELSEKERLSIEKAHIESDPHGFVENSIVENHYIRDNVTVTEIKENE